jgi:magnesium chelatase family protein
VDVRPLRYEEVDGPPGEPSAAVAERVRQARARQEARARETGIPATANAELEGAALRACAAPDREGQGLLEAAIRKQGLTARGYDRVLRVARTIADLEGVADVAGGHVAEALHFRTLQFG